MLKSLELAGFKSFAEKTRLEFPPGVTVVVGPNGSGKSNVVDAIKWVLGSQSPRSLRGKEMTDVIFNGAASRRPLNAAEVTITLDNPEADVRGGDAEPAEREPPRRRYPIDEAELRLTRRVLRSGEGEYLVNGRACRLRDFRELLAGAAVGPDSYSIIEQGRVDAALRATPQERRALFEEAAGISRFRIKRREADRRLERVEQNLLRLRDIVDEVEGRLKRVRAQASKAEKHRERLARLRAGRTELGLGDWRALSAERDRLNEQHGPLTANLEAARRQIDERERWLAAAEAETGGPAADLRAAEADLAAIRERMARDASTIAYESRRARDLEVEARRRRDAVFALKASDPVAQANEALVAAEATDAELAESLRATEARAASAAEAAADLRARAEATRAAHEQAAAAKADLERRRQRAAEQIAATSRTAEESQGKLEKAKQAEAATAGELAAATEAHAAAEAALAELQREQADVRERREASRRALTDSRQALAELRGRLAADTLRLETLAAEQRRLEALNRDVRALVAGAETESGVPTSVFGLVADLLHVDVDLATMIEAALGDKTNYVVVDDTDALASTLAKRPDALSARAGFVHLEASPASAAERIDLSGEPGVMGRADDFVDAEPRFEPLLERLLGRTWFVDTLATALRLSRTFGRGLSYVTHAGEVVGADGAVVVGPHEDIDSLLTRRREAERLRAEVEQLQRRLETTEARAAEAGRRDEEAEAEAERLRGLVAATQSEVSETAQRVAALGERRRHVQQESATQESALVRSRERLAQVRAELAEAERGGADQRGADEMADADPADSERRLAEAEATLVAESTRRDELAAAVARHRQVLETLRGGAPSPRAPKGLDAALAEWRAAEADLAASLRETLRGSARQAEDALRRDEAAGRRRRALEGDAAGRRQRREATAAVRALRAEADELLSRSAQIDLRRQQVEVELRTLAERMREDYDIDIARVASERAAPAADEPIDRDALRREVEQLRQQVNAAGPVNLESLEELTELESRHEQLATQYDDLAKAKASLIRLTGKINADSRGLYLASFETAREHFRELFARLFGGGEADLVFDGDDADDPLERGVDIVARPPGKELRSLSLLSGGEKTLTCVALLLALFRSKPSPFCILDEVDAALDEANIGRFATVLNEFLASTQFIVITHSKRTMVGADTLYGVTMQESGVSKHVSVRFEDVSEDGQIRVRGGGPAADAGGAIRRAA